MAKVALKKGHIEDGYIFTGGDPGAEKNWKDIPAKGTIDGNYIFNGGDPGDDKSWTRLYAPATPEPEKIEPPTYAESVTDTVRSYADSAKKGLSAARDFITNSPSDAPIAMPNAQLTAQESPAEPLVQRTHVSSGLTVGVTTPAQAQAENTAAAEVPGAPVRQDYFNSLAEALAAQPQDIQNKVAAQPGIQGRIADAAIGTVDDPLAPVVRKDLDATDRSLAAADPLRPLLYGEAAKEAPERKHLEEVFGEARKLKEFGYKESPVTTDELQWAHSYGAERAKDSTDIGKAMDIFAYNMAAGTAGWMRAGRDSNDGPIASWLNKFQATANAVKDEAVKAHPTGQKNFDQLNLKDPAELSSWATFQLASNIGNVFGYINKPAQVAYLTSMGIQSYGHAIDQGEKDGIPFYVNQAQAIGKTIGEVGSEYLPFAATEKLLKVFNVFPPSARAGLLRKMGTLLGVPAASFMEEGGEEFVNQVWSNMIDGLVSKYSTKTPQSTRERLANTSGSFQGVAIPFTQGAGNAFVAGGVGAGPGGFIAGVQGAVQQRQYDKAQQEINLFVNTDNHRKLNDEQLQNLYGSAEAVNEERPNAVDIGKIDAEIKRRETLRGQIAQGNTIAANAATGIMAQPLGSSLIPTSTPAPIPAPGTLARAAEISVTTGHADAVAPINTTSNTTSDTSPVSPINAKSDAELLSQLNIRNTAVVDPAPDPLTQRGEQDGLQKGQRQETAEVLTQPPVADEAPGIVTTPQDAQNAEGTTQVSQEQAGSTVVSAIPENVLSKPESKPTEVPSQASAAADAGNEGLAAHGSESTAAVGTGVSSASDTAKPSSTLAQVVVKNPVTGKYNISGFPRAVVEAARDKLKAHAAIISDKNAVFPEDTNIIALKKALGVSTLPEGTLLADGDRPYKKRGDALVVLNGKKGFKKTHEIIKLEDGGWGIAPKGAVAIPATATVEATASAPEAQADSIAPAAPIAAKKKTRAAPNELLALIRHLGGINTRYGEDMTGEKNPHRILPFMFKRNGLGLDELATMLQEEHGFTNINVNDVDGGVQDLRDMIQSAIAGNREYAPHIQQERQDKAQGEEYRANVRRQAEENGIRTVARPFADIEADVLKATQKHTTEELGTADTWSLADQEKADAIAEIADLMNWNESIKAHAADEATLASISKSAQDERAELDKQRGEYEAQREAESGTGQNPDQGRPGSDHASGGQGDRGSVAQAVNQGEGSTHRSEEQPIFGAYIGTASSDEARDTLTQKPAGSWMYVAHGGDDLIHPSAVNYQVQFSVGGGHYTGGDRLPTKAEALASGQKRAKENYGIELQEPLSLSGETNAEIARKEAERKKAEQEASAKANAPAPEDFALSGSNRAADQATAHGAQDLFAKPAKTFDSFVKDYVANQPIDKYEYQRQLENSVADIEHAWSNGSSDELTRTFGPDIVFEKLHEENNALYFDADGDLTDEGSQRSSEIESALSEKLAREYLGEPQRKSVDFSRPDHMAEVIHGYLESIGFDVNAIGGSGKSLSKYFTIIRPQGNVEIRISDHVLPVEYQDRNGIADEELKLYDLTGDVRDDGRDESVGISNDEALARAEEFVAGLIKKYKGNTPSLETSQERPAVRAETSGNQLEEPAHSPAGKGLTERDGGVGKTIPQQATQVKPASEMTPAEHLRAAADKLEGKLAPEPAAQKASIIPENEAHYYYTNGNMGMKSDGSFTAEKRHWMTFTEETALAMLDRGVKPYGATKVGVFTGTVAGNAIKHTAPDLQPADQVAAAGSDKSDLAKLVLAESAKGSTIYGVNVADRLFGTNAEEVRKNILSAIEGKPVSKSKAGYKNTITALYDVFGITEDAPVTMQNELQKVIEAAANGTEQATETTANTEAAGHKVGDMVSLTKPNPNGGKPINIGGRITRIMPDGKLEIRTRQDGYHIVSPSELGHISNEQYAASKAPASLTPIESHPDVFKRAREGAIKADEFKASFDTLLNSKADVVADLSKLTKDGIFKLFPNLEYRYKNEKKDTVVNQAYRDMVDDYALGESISYMTGEKYENVIRKMVDKTTDDTLAKYAEDVKASIAERAAARKEAEAGMENPETLQDFGRLMAVRAKEIGENATFGQSRMALTPDQRAKFDELAAEKSRGERATRKTAQQESVMRAPGEVLTTSEIIKTKHTKHGHDLWQFTLDQRVAPEEFKALVSQAKRLGGDYSSYRGNGAIPGWQFRTEEAAKAFKALVAGDATDAREVMQTRRDAYADDRSQTAVERLTEMAARLEEKADASLNQERKENTHRRAAMAASAEAAANSEKALAKTMRNLAKAIDEGRAKLLDKVRQKIQVETLRSYVHTGKAEMLRKLYPSYAEQEKHQYDAPTQEVADYMKFPNYTAYRSDLAAIGRTLLETEGTKNLGQRLMKVADDVSAAYLKFAKENIDKVSPFKNGTGGRAAFSSKSDAEQSILHSGFNGAAIVLPVKRNENLIILSPSEAIKRGVWEGDNDKRITLSDDFGTEIVEKLGRAARRGAKVNVPYQFENTYTRKKRLAGMNIETPAELRAAVREFISVQELPQEADKIKKMERAMIGHKNDGLDFFPTPAAQADEMIQAADIKEGMSVLEPSAGMGHIADQLRAAGVDPDVVELASDRRDLLEAKGYNLVGSDFMDVAEGNYDRIIMNPPFGDRRDAEHVQHAYSLLKPGGRLVSIMGEGVFFWQDKKAQAFRDWLQQVNATDEKLDAGTFMDASLPVNTSVNARMVVIDKPAVAPAFSRGTGTGMPKAKIQSIVDAVASKWDNAPEIVVIDDMSDPAIREEVRSENERQLSQGAIGQPEGFYDAGKVYIVASEMNYPRDVVRVLLHETLGHAGLRGAFGKSLAPILKQIVMLRRNDVQAKAKQYGLDVKSEKDMLMAAEEVLAEMAQKNPNMGFVKRAIAAIRSFLRDTFPKIFGKMDLTDAEIIRDYLMPARAFVQSGATYSRRDDVPQERTTAFPKDAELISSFHNDIPLKNHQDYKAAKAGNGEAAIRLVTDLVNPSTINEAKNKFGIDVAYLPVIAQESTGSNQIPVALAGRYAAETGGVLATNIFQSNKAYHTGANAMERLLVRSNFTGNVTPGQSYVLVDNVSTMGSTIADLTHYIQSNAGKVSGVILLTNASRSGNIRPSASTILELEKRHGNEISNQFGIEPGALTNDEAQYLIGFRSTDELRNRAATASAERNRRIASKALPESQGNVTEGDTRLSRSAPANTTQDSKMSELSDKLIYNFVDNFIDLRRLVNKSTPEKQDASLQQELYSGVVKARTDDFHQDMRDPLIKTMHKLGVGYDDLHEYLHAKHAPVRNKLMQDINPTAPELEAKRAALSATRDKLFNDPAVEEYLAKRKELRAAEGDVTDGVADQSLVDVLQEQADKLKKVPAAKDYLNAVDELKGLANIKPFVGDNTALSGMSDKEAAEVMLKAKQAGTDKALGVTADMVYAIIAKTRENMLAGGLITAAEKAAWENKYGPTYVPLHRDEVGANGMPPIGQGFNIRGKEAKAATGSNKEVSNILAHVVAQQEASIIRVEKNKVENALYEFLQNNPDPAVAALDTAEMTRTIDPSTGLAVNRVNAQYKNMPNVLTLKINGEEHTVTFNEQNPEAMRMAVAFKNLSAQELGEITKMIGGVTRFLATMNTSANPVFLARNFMRDIQTAYINLSDTELAGKKKQIFKNVPSAIRGFFAMTKGDTASEWAVWAREFRDAGGQTGWLSHYENIDTRANELRNMLEALKPGKMNFTIRQAKALWDLLQDANGAVENGVRLASYVAGRKNGMTPAKAAQLAKNLTVNFNKHGAKGVELNMWYMFMNASIQGTARLGKAAMHKNVQKILAAIVVSGFMLDVLARSLAGDDDDDGENDYDQLPNFVKANNWVFWVGGKPITVPMPYGYNFFASVGRKMSEQIFRKNYSAMQGAVDLAGIAMGAFSPLGSSPSLLQFVAPTVFDPFVQYAENKNFAGNPVHKEQAPYSVPKPEYQMGFKSASAPAQWLAEMLNDLTGGNEVRPGMINVNPSVLDFAVSTALGGAGKVLLQSTSLPLKLFSGEPIQAREIPFVNIFASAKPENQVEGKFYTNLRAVEVSEAEAKNYRGRPEYADIRADHKGELSLVHRAKAIMKTMAVLNKRQKVLKRKVPIDRAAVEANDAKRHALMSRFNKAYMAAQQ